MQMYRDFASLSFPDFLAVKITASANVQGAAAFIPISAYLASTKWEQLFAAPVCPVWCITDRVRFPFQEMAKQVKMSFHASG